MLGVGVVVGITRCLDRLLGREGEDPVVKVSCLYPCHSEFRGSGNKTAMLSKSSFVP